MKRSYFDTTHVSRPERAAYLDQALHQEERIYEFFVQAPEWLYTPTEVWLAVFKGENVPLTSVRRAMTVLTNKTKLIKTDRQRTGSFGRPEYCWRRRVGAGQQQEMDL